jgi:hypothetical protein
MDLYAAQQPATSTCDHPGGTGRRCVLFGCLEAVAWIISDPQGRRAARLRGRPGRAAQRRPARVPLDSSIRVEVWRA